jgi:hypothetical protein
LWHNFIGSYENKTMRLLILGAAITFLAACNGQKDIETKKDVVLTDTTGMYNSNVSTDTGTAVINNEQPQAPPQVIKETKVIYVDRTPGLNRVKTSVPKKVVTQRQTNNSSTQTNSSGNTTNTGTQNNSGNTSTTSTTANTPTTQPAQDKGWSNAKKDAVIGGVGGAVVGAVISKKKGKGAIVGGILGAAGGYILGKKKDKADTTR